MELTRKRLISTAFTIAVVALLYFSGPTTAVGVALDAITGSFYPGQTVPMTASITLSDYEFIMTTGAANLTITTPSATTLTCSLPITGTVSSQTVTCSNGLNITVSATTATGWDYNYGYGYQNGYAYDYAYTGYNYYPYNYQYGTNFGSYGYGYSYNTTWTATSLSYTIRVPLPYSYSNGTYTAKLEAYAGSTLLDRSTQEFTVAALTQLPKTTVGVRISEFMPNPRGSDDNSTIPGGEWLELENNGSSSVNISGWTLEESSGYSLTVSSTNTRSYATGSAVNSTVIPARGYLVVYRAGDANFDMSNSIDSVTLKNASGTIIDVVPYNAADFSLAGLFTRIAATEFPEGWSVILQAGVNSTTCTGVYVGGFCYTSTNTSTPGTSNPGSTTSFTKTLAEGYNLISVPITASNTTVQSVLGSIANNYSIVWQYDASVSNTSARWTRYMPANVTPNTLTSINQNLGFWVRVNATANQTMSLTGTAPTTTTQTLIGGDVYNLISYMSSTSNGVSTALAQIANNYSIVWQYDASVSNTSARWTRYMPANVTPNTLTNMTPGFGYWVRVNATANQTLITTY